VRREKDVSQFRKFVTFVHKRDICYATSFCNGYNFFGTVFICYYEDCKHVCDKTQFDKMQQDASSPSPSRAGAYRPLTFVSSSSLTTGTETTPEFPSFLIEALGAAEAKEFASLSRMRRNAYIAFLEVFLGIPPEFEEWVVFWNLAHPEECRRISKFHAHLEAIALNFADIDTQQRNSGDTPGAAGGKRRRLHITMHSRIFFSKAQGHFTYELTMSCNAGEAIPECLLEAPKQYFPTFTVTGSPTTAKLLVPSTAYLRIMLEHIAGICETFEYAFTDRSSQNVMTEEHHTKIKVKFRATEQDYCIYGNTYTIRDWLTAHNAVFSKPGKEDEPSFWSCKQDTKTALCLFAQLLGMKVIEQYRAPESA